MAPQQNCQERAAHRPGKALIREATKRPKITLKELQSSTVEIGVSLWKSGQKKSHCVKKKISKHIWCSTKGMWETPQTYGRRYSDPMRQKCSFLAIKENTTSGTNPTLLITQRTPSSQ